MSPRHIPAALIEDARRHVYEAALRTPLVRLDVDAPAEIFLKLENLQPIGSFKLRGATNGMAQVGGRQLSRGVYPASAGNLAHGVAWCARRRGAPCRVVVPDPAPEAKPSAIRRLGATIHA